MNKTINNMMLTGQLTEEKQCSLNQRVARFKRSLCSLGTTCHIVACLWCMCGE